MPVDAATRGTDTLLPGTMICPNCEECIPYPPTESDNATTTCPRCGHRFPVSDEPVD